MELLDINKENKISNKTKDQSIMVEVDKLSKSFGEKVVLKDFTMKLIKGENLVILGKSGSGKSVFIKLLVRLLDYDKGRIKILEKDVAQLNQDDLNILRQKIGFLFQSAALYDSMSVKENLEFPMRVLKDVTAEEKEKLVKETLSNVGLADAINKKPSELSGGMRKRIGLARTLILKPEIILYDEPTTGLDPITSKEISKLILEMQKKYNTTSIIITHDMDCAKITSNRVIILKDGAVGAEGTFDELSKSEDAFVHSFFE